MPRAPRTRNPGALYHLTAHATQAERLFRDELDREAFAARLAVEVDERRWVCHAYCLMDTHYHLLVETPSPDLGEGAHRLNGRYAWSFNRRHERKGHLFASRYHAAVLESERHLREAIRYIALNPVRAGACADPEAWTWSSYAATAGLEEAPAFLSVAWVLALFAPSRPIAQARYRAFVADGVDGLSARSRLLLVPGTVPGTAAGSRQASGDAA